MGKAILDGLETTETELSNNIGLTCNLNQTAYSLFLKPTNAVEVIKLITLSTLKSSKATGPDNINHDILKLNKRAISIHVIYLCNLSLSSGIVPNSLKIAEVIPVFKLGDPLELMNYKQISFLKLVEVVNLKLLKYLEANELLVSNQFGFRSARSTRDAIMGLVDFITDKINNRQKCVGIFLGMA